MVDANPLAELAAARLDPAAVVMVGVHVDGATPDDIAQLSEHAWQAVEMLLQQLE